MDSIARRAGELLPEFAGTANVDGVWHLLDLDVDVRALYREGDPYFDIAKDTTALRAGRLNPHWMVWNDIKVALQVSRE